MPSCREAMADAPSILDFLCPECSKHFEAVKSTLERQKISFVIDKHLVRGLDYYTQTTFEIQTSSLGAQNAVAGGGRYDNLVRELGGPDMPAIGFAIGFDRLVEITALNDSDIAKTPDVFVVALGKGSKTIAYEWACTLSINGITTDMDFSDRSLKSLMKRADRLSAKHVLIVGEKELDQGAVILRNMSTKEQVLIPIEGIVENIKTNILC